MGCKGCWECLLKVLNFFMSLAGLAMVGYGIYLLVQYNNHPHDTLIVPTDQTLVQLGRPMLVAVNLSDSIYDDLPKAWNDYFLNPAKYAFLVILLILLELAFAAVIFFDKGWKKEIPQDETGYFDMVYGFLRENWDIVRWVALGIVVFEALLFLLALIVRASNKQVDYDSDEEYINPRHQARQPLLNNKPASPVTGVPVAGTLDQRPSRNDAWSTRMREKTKLRSFQQDDFELKLQHTNCQQTEHLPKLILAQLIDHLCYYTVVKYGLDTSEFTYNPSESHRFQQPNPQPTEERSRCTIM
ncbi:hypothetical protein Ahy_B01g053368 [Arachis hypogaea]|uniref:Tobamovirus multiplication protein 2A n=1 Tax=Arachis hypogaea TaxID=3818 RepID=A0A445ARR5_ARAHY|nr:hypothetical protein Ahy_B01g053368 [Arachis hypogaea]